MTKTYTSTELEAAGFERYVYDSRGTVTPASTWAGGDRDPRQVLAKSSIDASCEADPEREHTPLFQVFGPAPDTQRGANPDYFAAPPTHWVPLVAAPQADWVALAAFLAASANLPQVRKAHDLGVAFGHAWANRQVHAFLNTAAPGTTWGQVYDAIEASLDPDAPAGVSGPDVDAEGVIAHSTATGRGAWAITPDCEVKLEVFRPPLEGADGAPGVRVLHATISPSGEILNIGRDARTPYHTRHVGLLIGMLAAVWGGEWDEARERLPQEVVSGALPEIDRLYGAVSASSLEGNWAAVLAACPDIAARLAADGGLGVWLRNGPDWKIYTHRCAAPAWAIDEVDRLPAPAGLEAVIISGDHAAVQVAAWGAASAAHTAVWAPLRAAAQAAQASAYVAFEADDAE